MNLSKQESEFLSRLSANGISILTTAEAGKVWRSATPIDTALHRLEKKGWLQRLDRGVYLLIPLEAGPERIWTESPLIVAPYLIQPSAVAYWSVSWAEFPIFKHQTREFFWNFRAQGQQPEVQCH
jgi:predicted transcriptional regulator of viral defense system